MSSEAESNLIFQFKPLQSAAERRKSSPTVCVGQDSGYKSLPEREVPAVWDDSWLMHEMFCVSNISCYSFRCFRKRIFSAVSIRAELDSITSLKLHRNLSTRWWKLQMQWRLCWSRFVWNTGRFSVCFGFLFCCFLFYFVAFILLYLTNLHFLSLSFFIST